MADANQKLLDLVVQVQKELPYKMMGFEQLVKLSYPTSLGLAWAITGDRDLANNIAQEVFIKVMHSLARLEDPAKYLPWMKKITVNVSRTWLAREKRELTKRQQHFEQNIAEEHKAEQSGREEAPAFHELLAGLGEEERTIISLKILNDLEFSEVAEITGNSLPATKMRYYRALQKIKEELND
jgi:RNA polymerase sigma-70 factor (ECF subfamily)